MNLARIIGALLALFILSGVSDAFAGSGVVRGRFRTWNKNGNYCPTGRDCTGSVYTQSQYDNNQPIRNVKVWVYNDTVGAPLGEGVTDDNGYYTIAWSYPGSIPNASQTYVYWAADHKENRFFIHYSNGTYPWWATATFTPQNGTTAGSPQQLGTTNHGSSAAPDLFANAYFGAEMEWREALNYVGVLQANFYWLEIRGFEDTIDDFLGECSTSCASGSANRVQLDDSAALKPEARVMHEMGHIAVYKAKAYTGGWPAIYCYPNTSGDGCGWSSTTAEWSAASFNEALATFTAFTALNYPDAPVPTYCNSTGACNDTSHNLETSSGSSCATDDNRRPMTVMKYLWDVYDTIDDGEVNAEGPAAYWQMMAVLASYGSGTSSNKVDEPWNSSYSALDARDGRAVSSYGWNYNNAFGTSLTDARDNNCNAL